MRTRLVMIAAGGLLTLPTIATAQDYRFTRAMSAGQTLAIENINGAVEVTRASGGTAEVTVTKTVKKGNGALVKAIMETTEDGIRVCTIYLNKDPNRNSCKGANNNRNDFEIDMRYVVKVPSGVKLDAETVNGNVTVTGLDAEAKVESVNGNVQFDGATASHLETVNGWIHASLSRGTWDGELHIETVNGGIELSFPSDLSAVVKGETVNGGITSAFPVTIEGRWGPKEMRGTIGGGRSKLSVETVNGGITIRKR